MNNTKPVNKQAAIFLSRKYRIETMQEALEGAVTHLLSGKLQQQLAEIFTTQAFGTAPIVTFAISIRRDPKESNRYSYTAKTKVTHDLGDPVSLYGLKP